MAMIPHSGRRMRRLFLFGLLTVCCLALFITLPKSVSFVIFVMFSIGLWALAIPNIRRKLLRWGNAAQRRSIKPQLLLRDFVLICMLLVLALMLAARLYLIVGLITGLIVLVALILAAQVRANLFHDIRRFGRSLIMAVQTASVPPVRPTRTRRLPRGLLVLLYTAEMALVLSVAWDVTAELRANTPETRLYGGEAEYLTSSAYSAARYLHTYGYLPLWTPWLEHGEPLITSPFSFVMNPISTMPSLLTDGLRGIKLSFAIYVMFAGIGGWFLGRVLGLGTVGRVLLGLLMVGRGSMHGPISQGFFQLAVSQAYMPWITAGAVATLRDHTRRWPPVLLAVMMTLLYFAGNLWYTLPMVITVALLALLHIFGGPRGIIDWQAIRRLAFAVLLTIGLSAVTLIPLWANRSHVDHPEEIGAGVSADLKTLLEFYVLPDEAGTDLPGGLATYYAYVTPVWFLLLLFVYIPPLLPPLFSHPARPGQWRIWVAGLILLVFATMWSMGTTPLFTWLYEKITLLREWRFVGRALAVGAFWIAVLVALRIDALVQFVSHPVWRRRIRGLVLIQAALVIGLSYAGWQAAGHVIDQWGRFGLTEPVSWYDDACLKWLRDRYPDEPLSAYRYDYEAIYPYIDNEVRKDFIEVAYRAIPLSSIYPYFDMRTSYPKYAIIWLDDTRMHLRELGYNSMPGSPRPLDGKPCAYVRSNAYPYAFAVRDDFVPEALYYNNVTPIPLADRKPDRITLFVQGVSLDSLLVVVDELAYPGWIARLDGERVKVESIGGLNGVFVPPGQEPHTIVFQFRPILFIRSAWITLITITFVILYLLRAERLARR